MTSLEKRLLTCRLLEAICRDPEYCKKLELVNVSFRKHCGKGREKKTDGKKTSI